MKLWQKILIGLTAGIILGLAVSFFAKQFPAYEKSIGSYVEYFHLFGDIFMNLIKMLVGLLIFSSMTVGVTSIRDPKKLGRVGSRALGLYLITTVTAIVIGFFFAYVMRPGRGMSFSMNKAVNIENVPSWLELFKTVIPDNPMASFAEGNVLQIIVFSIFLGLAINASGKKAEPLLKVLEALSEAMYELTTIVMEFAPYGVFAIMTWVVNNYGVKVLGSLAKFLLCNYLACFFHTTLVLGGMLIFFARLNPWNFFKGMSDAIAIAFSTNSSSATLPVSLHCVQENLGVSKDISNFVLPLGATVNMNGAAISQAITAIFISQAYDITLDIQALVSIVVTATLSAIGAAGIPGTTLVMLGTVLASAGLPLEGILIVTAIDRIREMVTTVVNILGDAVVAVYIAKMEGELDVVRYNHEELVNMQDA